MNISARPTVLAPLSATSRMTRSLSSAAAFSVKVKATMFRGSAAPEASRFAIRCEMTCVFPEPAHAMICRVESTQLIADC